MSNPEKKLEEKLRALEEGQPIEQVLADDEQSSELGSLIQLAESIKGLPHPELSRKTIQEEKQRLIAAARDKRRANPRKQGSRVGGFTGQWLFVPAAAGLALILLMVFVLAAGMGFYFAGPTGAHFATMTDISGQVLVSENGQADDWSQSFEGDRVRSGQRVQTGPDSEVTLVFFDGTRTRLAANSDLMMTQVDGSWGDVLQVTLIQNEGQTNHQVVPFQSDNASFQVLTPTGSASVHGTDFSVLVADTGKSLFAVSTGQVLVSNEGSQAFVNAGQSVISELGKPLVSPTYLFVLQGELQSKVGGMWTVEGATFRVKGSTVVEGGLQVGDDVLVQGRIWKNGWIADSIHSALGDYTGGEYSGMVEQQEGTQWVVGGFNLQVESNPDDIQVGDFVHVSFEVLEGGAWNALELVLLDGSDESPEADEDSEEEPAEEEGLSFDLDEYEATACEALPAISATLTYLAGEGSPDPLEVTLGFDPESVPAEVEQVLVEPEGPFPMNSGDTVYVSVTFTLAEGSTGLAEGSELKLRVFTTSEAEDVEFKVELKCEAVSEEEEDQEEEDQEDGDTTCTGNERHPKAVKLEAEFSQLEGLQETVDYDQIMEWFCEYHYGFGEIDQMVNLAAKYEILVEVVFDLREGGLGWGQIKQQLAAQYTENAEDYMNPAGKVPPGKLKSEENKNKEKPNKKGDD